MVFFAINIILLDSGVIIINTTIDIIIPCYNEEEVLNSFFIETEKVVQSIDGCSFRYILVDDGSRDRTLEIMHELASANSHVKYISFSKNFGKESGMYAGLSNSDSDYVIIMDADLQHPPALIPDMIKGIQEGYDCVAACRTDRKGEKKIRSFFSQSFYKVNNRLTNSNLPYGAVDYRIMSRPMVKAVLSMSEVERFSKGIFSWVGFKTKWLPYDNVERTLGTTKWSFKGLTKYAIDGITSFSVAPLHFISVMGFSISAIAIIYGIIIFFKTLILGIDVPGYASLIIILLFLGGIIELSLGVIGEYLSRVFIESKNRPIFIARETNIKSATNVDNGSYSSKFSKEDDN